MDGPVGIYNQPSTWTLETAYAYATAHAVPSPDPDGEPLYNCPFSPCSKQFSKRFNLKAHLRVHTGDKPFICSFPGCTRRFMWKSSLTSHQTGHSRRKAELAKRSASSRDRCLSQSQSQPSTCESDTQLDRTIPTSSWSFNHHTAPSNFTSTYPSFSQQQHQQKQRQQQQTQQHDLLARPTVFQARRLHLSHQSPHQQHIHHHPNTVHHDSQNFLPPQSHPSSQSQLHLQQSALNHQNAATTSAPAMSFISTDDALPVPLVHPHPSRHERITSNSLSLHPPSVSVSQSFPLNVTNSSQPLTQPATCPYPTAPPMSNPLSMSRTDSAVPAPALSGALCCTLQYPCTSSLPPRPHDTAPVSSSCFSNHGNLQSQSRLQQPAPTTFHQASHSSPSYSQFQSQPDFHRLSATSAPLYNEVYSESRPEAPRQLPQTAQLYGSETNAAEGDHNDHKTIPLNPQPSPPLSSSTNPFSHPTSNSEVRSSNPSTQPSPSSSSSPCRPSVSQPNPTSSAHPSVPTPDKQLLSGSDIPNRNNAEQKMSPSKMEDVMHNADSECDIKEFPQAAEAAAEAVAVSASAAQPSPVITPSVLKKPPKTSGLGSSHATCGSLSTSSLLPSPSASLGMPVSPSAFSQQFLYRDALSPTWPSTSNGAQIGGPFSNVAAMTVSPKPDSGRVTPMEVQMASLDGHSGDRNGSISGNGIGIGGGESSPLPVDLPISPGVTSPVPPPMLPQVQNGSRPRRMVNRGMKPPLATPSSLSSAAAGGLLPPLSGAAPKNPPTHIDLGGLVDDEPNSSLPALGGPHTDFSPLPVASPIFGTIVTPTSPFSALAHSATVKSKSTTTPTSTW